MGAVHPAFGLPPQEHKRDESPSPMPSLALGREQSHLEFYSWSQHSPVYCGYASCLHVALSSLYLTGQVLFLYLAALGLSCGSWDPHCVRWGVVLRHRDSLVMVPRLRCCGTWAQLLYSMEESYFPHQGLNLCPLHCKSGS